jgi:hypothetical protein
LGNARKREKSEEYGNPSFDKVDPTNEALRRARRNLHHDPRTQGTDCDDRHGVDFSEANCHKCRSAEDDQRPLNMRLLVIGNEQNLSHQGQQ